MRKTLFAVFITLFFVISCTRDQNNYSADLDSALIQKLIKSSPTGDPSYYLLPDYRNLARVPQDVLNPLNTDKVKLGQFLFFDTGLGLSAVHQEGMGTFSCATCHVPSSGFTPGQVQGIGDGGIGFGISGDGRVKDNDYDDSELDIQSIRPLSLVNVGFVQNTFWNGQFGSSNVNIGTEHLWDEREDTQLNHLGNESIETQNAIGYKSHRFDMSLELAESYGYKDLFDDAFPNIKEEYRYSLGRLHWPFQHL